MGPPRGQVADLEPLAAGREAEVFEWTHGRVLRLARRPEQFGDIEREAQALAAVAGAGAPRSHGIVEVDGRPGIVLDRIDGSDLLAVLIRRPWQVRRVGATLGRLHASIHEIEGPRELPALRELVVARLGQVPADVRERAEALLAELPPGDRLCHGDFHPGNVLRDRRGLRVIDWTNASRGEQEADVARTVLLLAVSPTVEPLPPYAQRMDGVGRRLLVDSYLRAYRHSHPLDLEVVERWLAIGAAVRLTEGVDQERPALLALAGGDSDIGIPARYGLGSERRRWLWRNAVAVPAVVNAVVNGLVAWLGTLGMEEVPLWAAPVVGGTSTVMDTWGTLFLLPLITCLLLTPAVRRALERGDVAALGWAEEPVPELRLLPDRLLPRAIAAGAATFTALAAIATAALVLLAPDPMTAGAFFAYKVAFAVALGAVVTPLLAIRAMMPAVPSAPPGSA